MAMKLTPKTKPTTFFMKQMTQLQVKEFKCLLLGYYSNKCMKLFIDLISK